MAIVTMTQALKKLYKAVVGEDTTKNNPTKIVSELADNYSGGGGGGTEPLIARFTGEQETVPSTRPGEDARVYNLVDVSAQDAFNTLKSGKLFMVAQESLGGYIEYILPSSFVDGRIITFSNETTLDALLSGKLGAFVDSGGAA